MIETWYVPLSFYIGTQGFQWLNIGIVGVKPPTDALAYLFALVVTSICLL